MKLQIAAWALAAFCQGLDIHTTNKALNRGFVEGNPLLGQSKARIFGTKVVIDAGVVMFWVPNRKKKVSVVAPLSLAGAGCAAGIHNAAQMNRFKEDR